jgi:hypothetical protein
MDLPPLKEEQVLAWADAYFAAHGKWPGQKSGPIPGTQESWSAVAVAMYAGCRGFRRRTSLAQLLVWRRGARSRIRLPRLGARQILAWAREYLKETGRRPNSRSGPIAQSPGETWMAVDNALRKGSRGLPGGSSLAQLLRKYGLK